MDDKDWILLLLLMSSAFKDGKLDLNNLDFQHLSVSMDPSCLAEALAHYNSEEEKRKRLIMENCPMIEYEQDMGAHIPFCRMDGEMCNMQCLKRSQL